ncbi:MAG TPA: hypothetical protein VGR35_01015 [Tepidisphaeraceae bacterium]|nr:hypothetical protein [Tepidisphaeraceae bacterium]
MGKAKGSNVTIEQFRTTQKAQPFVPFTIRLADGRKYDIDHPDFVSSHPQGRTIVVYKPGEHGDLELIDLLLVVGLEVHHSKQNGRKRRSVRA